MAAYQLMDGGTFLTQGIVRTADKAFIPIDTSNRDYADYLVWVAEGGIPDASPDVDALDTNILSRSQLVATNVEVITYRDQVANSHATDLTPAEYQTCLDDRQTLRDDIT